jgi:hypothetical protein
MYIQLEEDDLIEIANKIASWGNTDGSSFYYSPLEIEVKFMVDVSSHVVGDYESGYSETIIDNVNFNVKPIETEGVVVEYDHKMLEKLIENYLWDR